MKIYTYYQDISHSSQNELIDLWKISWSRHGYEPIVLNLEDAKKHSYFETLNTEMRRIYNEITGKQINAYGMSCWFRWLAYATQTEEKFYVSDYDAINVNFPVTEPNDKLHLMDNDCPFLASGTPKQFENLCKAFVEVSNERIEILKQQASHYHDQEFFQYNFMPRYNDEFGELRSNSGVLMTRDRTKIGGYYNPVTKTITAGPHAGEVSVKDYKVAHISHASVAEIFDKHPKNAKNYINVSFRIEVIDELLNI